MIILWSEVKEWDFNGADDHHQVRYDIVVPLGYQDPFGFLRNLFQRSARVLECDELLTLARRESKAERVRRNMDEETPSMLVAYKVWPLTPEHREQLTQDNIRDLLDARSPHDLWFNVLLLDMIDGEEPVIAYVHSKLLPGFRYQHFHLIG